jgi:enoyl-CoA hydratase
MPTEAMLTLDNAVARLTLRSPDGENRLGAATLRAIADACATVREDPRVRVLLLRAEGHAFSLGWDAETLTHPEAAGLPGDPFSVLAELPQPVIASVGGDALSGGLELALACDLRVMAESARLAFPEIEHGLLPLAGGTQRLPRLIGRGRAASLLLLGEVIDGATAFVWGLASAATSRAALDAAAEQLANTIAARGPIAERFAKEALAEGIEMPLARALRYETDLTVLLQTTSDRAEGVQAFAAKREPRFTGE